MVARDWLPAMGMAVAAVLLTSVGAVPNYTAATSSQNRSQPQPTALSQLPVAAAAVYDDCFSSYGCFGAPAGCVMARSCDVMLTYASSADGLRLGLLAAAQQPTYAALGLSTDAHMGSDAVIYCAYREGATADLYYGYNDGHSSTFITGKEPNGTSDLKVWTQNGLFMCTFLQEATLHLPGHNDINLTENHFLLVSTGAVDDSGPHYHHDKKIASGAPVNLTEYSAVPVSGVSTLV